MVDGGPQAGATVELACREVGAGPPLVILHGLFGSKRNWATIAAALGARHRVLTVDLRNHGASPWAPVHDYPALAADVARLIESRVGGSATVVGHSMGGKAAMTLALTRPALVERLVVVDIAPARSSTAVVDLLRAMREVPLATCPTRADVAAALAPAVPDPGIRAFLVHNVVAGPAGLSWAVNLEALERNADAILGFPEVPAGIAFTKPALFVAGGRSDYLRPEHRAEILRLFPNATLETIAAASHWVHADAPEAFLDTVGRFLAER